jgi:hypothetical protein
MKGLGYVGSRPAGQGGAGVALASNSREHESRRRRLPGDVRRSSGAAT